MSLGRSITQGMMGMFYKSGIDIEDLDLDNRILVIAIPKDSYDYHNPKNKAYHDPESFVKRIKQIFIEMGIFPSDCKIRYRVKDVIWTKEMGEQNFEAHKKEIATIGMGGFNW